MNSLEVHAVELAKLQGACESALTPDNTDTYYGLTVVEGVVVNASIDDLGITQSAFGVEPAGLVESTRDMALRGIGRCVFPTDETPKALVAREATYYKVEDRLTEISGIVSGHIGQLTIRLPDNSELVTITTVEEDRTRAAGASQGEYLEARVWAKGGRIVDAMIRALSAEDLHWQDECIAMFGPDSYAVLAVGGDFNDESELTTNLGEIREAMLSVNAYSPTELDEVLEHVRRIGRASKAERQLNRGLTSARISRLTEFALQHTGEV